MIRKLTWQVSGMSCAACSAKIEKVLQKMPGVKATVNLATEKLTLVYDDTLVSKEEIKNKIQQIG